MKTRSVSPWPLFPHYSVTGKSPRRLRVDMPFHY
jgi:hypothetical protein